MNFPYRAGPLPLPAVSTRTPRPVARVEGLAVTASVAAGSNAFAEVLLASAAWDFYRRVLSDGDRPVSNYLFSQVPVAFVFLALWAPGAAFIFTWLWQARRNAEALHQGWHRRSRGWVIGGWLCPVLNLWVPLTVVSDVWEASDPETPYYRPELGGSPSTRPVLWWWSCRFTGILAGSVAVGFAIWGASPRVVYVAVTVSACLAVVAAMLFIGIIQQITTWQGRPRDPVPVSAPPPIPAIPVRWSA